MNILLTGGTGFLGEALARRLVEQNARITVLTHRRPVGKLLGLHHVQVVSDWDGVLGAGPYSTIINLAGAPILGTRWSARRKQLIRDSRVALTQQLVATIARMDIKPELLISGSAIGYYGAQGDTWLTEASGVGTDFAATLCRDWEQAALGAETLGMRVCLIRTGLVLARHGGMLQQMLPAFRLGLGGILGDGQQWQSWIHLQDWLAMVLTMMTDKRLRGAYNATAPNPVRNAEFTQVLAARLHRPAVLPVPAPVLRGLLGEMSALLLASQRVSPQRLAELEFKFRYADLADALAAEFP